MSTLDSAIHIATEAHYDQKDKGGQPYILHPLRVMMLVEGEEAQIVAVLHDVLEDTEVTREDLEREGFSEKVITALEKLTHKEGESYSDYVLRVKSDELARQVKLADLKDNARIDRAYLRPFNLEGGTRKLMKYMASFKFLTNQITEEEYKNYMGK